MAQITIDPASAMPLVEQVVEGMRALVDKGVLRPGMKIASIRAFARNHAISAHTATEAYERLVALGILESRLRSGFFVKAALHRQERRERAEIFEKVFDHLWQVRSQLVHSDTAVNVSSGKLPQDWLDHRLLKSSMKALAAKADSSLVHYGDPFGYLPLRLLLQTRLADLGIHADSGQVLLTLGASHGIDIVLNYLLRRGDRAMVDDPGYFNLFNNLQLHGVEPLGVRRRTDGPDLDMVEAYAREHRPAVMFTQGILHTPTGSTISPGVAHRLLRLAEQYDFRIVENDVYADMMPVPATRLAMLDQLTRVLYVGSFSKTLGAGMRVGFIAGEKALVQELSNIKMITTLTGSLLDERLAFHALTETRHRKTLLQLRERLADSIDAACGIFAQRELELFCRPAGGKFLWLRHPRYEDSEVLSRMAIAHNLVLAPGKVFRPGLQPTPWFRINVAYAAQPALLNFLNAL